ncbi:hypothetical protein ACK2SD_15110 [Pseudomonas sp. SC11]|uniref:hypothetical protein n=1 Tax=Pseudomonas sp. SC11 TaxID=326927 RepID=UPI00399A891F
MQLHHYVLAISIGWMVTLIILPFLIAKTRRFAYNRGFEAGKAFHDQTLALQLQEAKQARDDLRTELQRTRQACEQQLAARQANITALKTSISELEARIMSYTGLAVTKADYDLLTATAETLGLTERTLSALKAGQQASKARNQIEHLTRLAKRMHAHLRETPSSAGAAA